MDAAKSCREYDPPSPARSNSHGVDHDVISSTSEQWVVCWVSIHLLDSRYTLCRRPWASMGTPSAFFRTVG